jgi:hypothetical protein
MVDVELFKERTGQFWAGWEEAVPRKAYQR